MRTILLFTLLSCLAAPAFAETPTPEEIINKTINLLKMGKPMEAFEAALESSRFIKQKQSDLDSAKYQFSGFVTQVGAPLGCELLAHRNLIDRYRIDQYLCLSEVQPFVIQFDFYKPKGTWLIQGFSFNTQTDDYIEESINSEIGQKSTVEK